MIQALGDQPVQAAHGRTEAVVVGVEEVFDL
jgi:hypothetical protein